MAKRKGKFKNNSKSKRKKSSNLRYTSIKVGFNQILRRTKNTKKIIKEIRERSVKAAELSVLSSLLILLEVNKAVYEEETQENIQFEKTFFEQNISKFILQRFRALCEGNTLNDNIVYDTFIGWLDESAIRKPNCIGWGNSFVYNYEQYETCWCTNINIHAKNRFIKFFKSLVDDFTIKDIKDTATFIFNVKSRVFPNTELLNHLNVVGIVPEPEDQFEEEENSESDDSMRDFEDVISINSSESENSDGPVNMVFAGFTRGFFKRRLKVDWFKTTPAFIRMQRHIDRYNMTKEQEREQQQQQRRQQQLAKQQQQQLAQQQQKQGPKEPKEKKKKIGRKVNKVIIFREPQVLHYICCIYPF